LINIFQATFKITDPGNYTIDCKQDGNSVLTKELDPVKFLHGIH
jgi:hypothetical protein